VFVYIETKDSYAIKSPDFSKFAASIFNGLVGSGSPKSEYIAIQIDFKVHTGDHSFFNISRQTSPV
ncbi:hypothetical protein BB560_006491, partial [Smittium megazygosporum]